jgi:hypothetical protein
MTQTVTLLTSRTEEEVRELIARATARMEEAAKTFLDGEQPGDSITLMTALSLGIGAALANTIMRLDMPDGNNPRQSIDYYHGLIRTGAHEKLPHTPEWRHYRDRYG